jgi:hypothetical protein
MAVAPDSTQIVAPRVELIDPRTGLMSREWYRFFYNLYEISGGGNGIIPVSRGGTGTNVTPSNGRLLIGNGVGYTVNPLGGGAGITVLNAPGNITLVNSGVLSNIAGTGVSVNTSTGNVTISNTGVLSNIAGTGVSVSASTGNVTISNTGVLSIIAGAGVSVSSATGDITVANTGVLSIIAGAGVSVSSATGNVTVANTGVLSFSAGTTGLTPATDTTGVVTLAGTLNVANGGTGQGSYTDGQLLIGNSTGNTLTKNTLTAGAGIAISNGPGAVTIATSGILVTSAPVTKTADFTVAADETWLINNKSGSTCTVTLPAPSALAGRTLHFQNYQDQLLVSASSNVVPLAGGAAGTAVLDDVAGAHATLVSDGANWVMTQYGSNNALLLE